MSSDYDIDTIEEFKEKLSEDSYRREIVEKHNHNSGEDCLFLDNGMRAGIDRTYSINPELHDELKNNIDFMMVYAESNKLERDEDWWALTSEHLGDIPEEICKNVDFIETALRNDNLEFYEIPQCLDENLSELIDNMIDDYPDQIFEEYFSDGIVSLESMEKFTNSNIHYLKHGADEFYTEENLRHYINDKEAIGYFKDHMDFSEITDKEIAETLIRENHLEFLDCHQSLQEDIDFCKQIGDVVELENFSEHLDNKEFVLHHLNNNANEYDSVNCLSDEMLSDKEICEIAVKVNPSNYSTILNDEIRENPEIALSAINKSGSQIEYIHPDLCSNKEFALSAIESIKGDYLTMKHFGAEIQSDVDVIKLATSYNPKEAKSCDIGVLVESGILTNLLKQKAEENNELRAKINENSSPEDIIENKIDLVHNSFSFTGVEKSPILPTHSQEYQNTGFTKDPENIILIVDSHTTPGINNKFDFNLKKSYEKFINEGTMEKEIAHWKDLIPNELKNDKEFMGQLIQKDGFFLGVASNELKNDKELVQKATEYHPSTIMFAGEDIKKDFEFIVKAGTNVPEYLQQESNQVYREKYEKMIDRYIDRDVSEKINMKGYQSARETINLAEKLQNDLVNKQEMKPAKKMKI